jgi:coiled-coil-helix-coiled-coil-helix domain-containing protein 10
MRGKKVAWHGIRRFAAGSLELLILAFGPVTHSHTHSLYVCFFQRSRRAAPARAAPAPSRRPMTTAAAKPAPRPPAPAPAAHPPAVAQPSSGGGGMLSGIGSTIVQGMAFGTGSAIAHRAVGAVADSFSGNGGGANEAAPAAAPDYAAGAMQAAAPAVSSTEACSTDKTMFFDCLQQNKGDQQACHFLYEQLKDCQQNQMQFA